MRNLIGSRGLVGGIQGGVSTANLQQVLLQKGLTSANLSAALSPVTPSPAPTAPAPAAPQAPKAGSTKT